MEFGVLCICVYLKCTLGIIECGCIQPLARGHCYPTLNAITARLCEVTLRKFTARPPSCMWGYLKKIRARSLGAAVGSSPFEQLSLSDRAPTLSHWSAPQWAQVSTCHWGTVSGPVQLIAQGMVVLYRANQWWRVR